MGVRHQSRQPIPLSTTGRRVWGLENMFVWSEWRFVFVWWSPTIVHGCGASPEGFVVFVLRGHDMGGAYLGDRYEG